MKGCSKRRAKREMSFDLLTDWGLNAAICLVMLSVPCFIFGFSTLGFVLLGVCGAIILLTLAAFAIGALVVAEILKRIPHR